LISIEQGIAKILLFSFDLYGPQVAVNDLWLVLYCILSDDDDVVLIRILR